MLGLAEVQLLTGDIDAAKVTFTEFFGPDAVKPWLEHYLPARVNGTHVAEAKKLIETFNNRNQYSDQAVVVMFAAIGANDEALDILFESADIEDDILKNVWMSPHFADMRKLPRFKALLEHYGLPNAWRESSWPKFCRAIGDDDFECE